jgi:hypothetical protein
MTPEGTARLGAATQITLTQLMFPPAGARRRAGMARASFVLRAGRLPAMSPQSCGDFVNGGHKNPGAACIRTESGGLWRGGNGHAGRPPP